MENSNRVTASDLEKELLFTASRSGGPGGQNVNKVSTKITLTFDVLNSQILTTYEKGKILESLSTRITKDGLLILTSSDTRSQLKNKEAVTDKLDKLLDKAFYIKKIRRKTKPPKSANTSRLADKKKQGEKKKLRNDVE